MLNNTNDMVPVGRSSQVFNTRLQDAVPQHRHGCLLQDIDGQQMLVKNKSDNAFVLNHATREIWDLCDGINTVGAICRLLAVRYGSSDDEMTRDVSEAIQFLHQKNCLDLPGYCEVDAARFTPLDLRDIKFYVINCEGDKAKKSFMQDQLDCLGLDYEFSAGVRCDPHPIGIALSHLKILKREDIQLPFAILEDDCQFTEDFVYQYDLPEDTDALYLGVSHFGLEQPGEFGWGIWNSTRFTRYTRELLRVYNMFARHAIVYVSKDFREQAIEASIRALTTRDYTYPADIEYARLHNTNLVLTPISPACYQSEKHHGNHNATRRPLGSFSSSFPDPDVPQNMEIVRQGDKDFYLFVDIFMHWSGSKITAVAPHYDDDIVWQEHGIDFADVILLFGPYSAKAQYIPHRLDSWEPSIILDFEHPFLEAYIREHDVLQVELRAGAYSKKINLDTRPRRKYETAMSLVIRDENRWLSAYLEYYLDVMGVEHVYLYDNHTRDRRGLINIVAPYVRSKRVTYIPWHYRWRNELSSKQIGQPTQEVQCLNKYGATTWIGFFDIDEFLRIPGATIPDFLGRYDAGSVGGISFGLRWFMYQGQASYKDLKNPLLECLHMKKDELGRKRQKLFVSPRNVRFMRFHWIQEDQQEIPVDDEEIFFHHYYLTESRFHEGKVDPDVVVDEYMLQFKDRFTALPAQGRLHNPKPRTVQQWIEHVERSFNNAEAGVSGIDAEVLLLEGMSGTYTRHFYNNLCDLEDGRFVEVGSWKGSSLCAAMSNNCIDAVAIDNWSEFNWSGHEDPRDVFFRLTEEHIGQCSLDVFEEDCFDIDTDKLGSIDIYLYDGNHSEDSHYKAISCMLPALSDVSVIIIDDWNFPEVRAGTEHALTELEGMVAYRKTVLLPDEEVQGMPHHPGRHGWWNGICILVLDKQGKRK